jgi:hypothetical protein
MEILKFSEPPKRSGRSRSSNKSGLMPLVSFGIAVLVLGGMSTTLAGTITLNSSGNVEFGQGIVTTAACDQSIRVTPATTYDTATSTFAVTQLVVDGIGVASSDTTSATQIASGCLNKIFKFRAYTDTGVALSFTPSGAASVTSIQFRLMQDTGTAESQQPTEDITDGISALKSGDFKALTGTAPSGSPGTNTGIITLSNFTLPATVVRITLETSQ